ncbi:uracil-DNA glycosylase [Amycolatopsis sp. NPDC059021]|uniref:uracil-DNA glycosylase n=1 Tax=Amycolatopsis sp. NPDC059021 TaxID=3346704 RepID=UPI00366FCE7A
MHTRPRSLAELDAEVIGCRACPRLVAWREQVARTKRPAYADQEYWARPVPGFGPADAALAIVGLAPSAHGANRTGRMFTGDPSGDFLFRALHEVGLASQPTSTAIGDGLALSGTRIVSPVRCAPPENKPTPAERDTCRPWLAAELGLLRPALRAIVVLGAFGWQALMPVLAEAGWPVPSPRPAFGHGAVLRLDDLRVFGCYHVSPRNVQTHRVTHAMVCEVLASAAEVAGLF